MSNAIEKYRPSGPPAVDFSQEAIAKAIQKETVQSPFTLLGFAGMLLGGLVGALFGWQTVVIIAILAGVFLGVGSFSVNYFFRREILARIYTRKMQKMLEEYRNTLRASIKTDLEACANIKGAEGYAEQGRMQFEEIANRFRLFQENLERKLNPDGITFGRYAGTAEQVYLAVLDNLRQVADLLKSVSAVDNDYVEDRLRKLGALTKIDLADEQEIKTMNERKAICATQMQKVNEILTRNEEAFTEMDQAMVAVTSLKLGKGEASMDLESARKELEHLAERAAVYASKE